MQSQREGREEEKKEYQKHSKIPPAFLDKTPHAEIKQMYINVGSIAIFSTSPRGSTLPFTAITIDVHKEIWTL